MYRVDGPDTAPALPAIQPPGAHPGFFQAGQPTQGKLATVVTADWANTLQEEIIAVVDWAGIALDKSSLTQLRDALLRMFRPVIAQDIGTANAINLSVPKGAALEWGLQVSFPRAAANTGPVTVSYNGSAPQTLYSPAFGGQLEGGELYEGWFYTVAWGGTGWMLSDKPGGAMPVPDASKPHHAINLSQFPALFDGRFPGSFNNVFPAAFDARFSAEFVPNFDARWNTLFDPFFNGRFAAQFPGNFDTRFNAEFPGAYQDWWNNWVLPNFFKTNVGASGFAHWYQHPTSGGNTLYIQTGRFICTYGAGQFVPFPIAFPNYCVGITGNDFTASSWGTPSQQPTPTTIGFEVPGRDYFLCYAVKGTGPPRWASNGDQATVSWIAMGF